MAPSSAGMGPSLGAVSDLAAGSELDQAHAGRASPSPPNGNCSPGRGPGRGAGKLYFFPSFLFLQGLVGMSPVKTRAHICLASPSPCLLADCHILVSAPIMTLCSFPTSLWHCLGPSSLWSSWKKGRFEQPNPTHYSPLPPAFFPFLPALIQRKEWAGFQVSTRLCLAQLLRADDSGKSGGSAAPAPSQPGSAPPGTASPTTVPALSERPWGCSSLHSASGVTGAGRE